MSPTSQKKLTFTSQNINQLKISGDVISPHTWKFIRNMNAFRRQNSEFFKLLNPTSYVMHQQFNIQQLYALPTLYLCVLYLSENKQRLVPLTA